MAGRQSLASGAGMEARKNSISSSMGTSLGGTSRNRGYRPMKLPTIDMRTSRGLFPSTDVQRSGFCNGYQQSIASRRCTFMKIMGPNCDGVPGCCKPDMTNDKCGMSNEGDCSFLRKNHQGDTLDETQQDRESEEVIERRQSRRVSKAQSSFLESDSCAPAQRNNLTRKCNLTRERAQTVECPPRKPDCESESESSSCATCSSSNESNSQNDPETSSSFRVTPQNYRSVNDLKSSSRGTHARPSASDRMTTQHGVSSKYSEHASSNKPKHIVFLGDDQSRFSGNSRYKINGDPSLMFNRDIVDEDNNDSDSSYGDEMDDTGKVSTGEQAGASQVSKFRSQMSQRRSPGNPSTANQSSVFKKSKNSQVDSTMLPDKSTVKSSNLNINPRTKDNREEPIPYSTFGSYLDPKVVYTSRMAPSVNPSKSKVKSIHDPSDQARHESQLSGFTGGDKHSDQTKPSQYATSWLTAQYTPSNQPAQYTSSNQRAQYTPSNQSAQYATSTKSAQHAPSKSAQYASSNQPAQYATSTKPAQYATSNAQSKINSLLNETHRAESCPSGVICSTPGVNSRCQDADPDIKHMDTILRQINDDRHGAPAAMPRMIPQQLIDQLWGVVPE